MKTKSKKSAKKVKPQPAKLERPTRATHVLKQAARVERPLAEFEVGRNYAVSEKISPTGFVRIVGSEFVGDNWRISGETYSYLTQIVADADATTSIRSMQEDKRYSQEQLVAALTTHSV